MIAVLLPKTKFSLMHTVAVGFFLVFALGFAPAQEAKQQSAKTSQAQVAVSVGRQTFASTCASCHGLDGKGGERGPDIATRSEITGLSDEELLRVLRTGIPDKGMPPFAALGSAKLSGLLSYIRSLQGKVTAMPMLGDKQKGRELFSGKAGCSECHMVNGAGGFLGPDLSNYGDSHPVSDIHTAIVSPERKTGTRSVGAEVTTKDDKVYSGVVRNEDNFSVQLQALDGTFHFFSKSDLAGIKYRKDSLMPSDYGAKLSVAEVDALAAYLVETAHAKQKP